MKRCALIFLFLLASAKLIFSQTKPFAIYGKINGKEKSFKYAYLFDKVNGSFISNSNIENNGFAFKGDYSENRFGALPSCTLILSNDLLLSDSELNRSKKDFSRNIIFEPEVTVEYNGIENKFYVEGGELNKIHNLFYDIDYSFSNKEDSLETYLKNTADYSKILRVEKQNLRYEADSAYIKVIKANYNSPVALDKFSRFAILPIFSVPETVEIYNNFTDEIKKSLRYTLMKKDLDNRANSLGEPLKAKLNIGEAMPVFKELDNNGKFVKSTDIFSAYTLIDFWASWCVPCMEEIPYIRIAQNEYKDKGFRVIAISVDKLENKHLWLNAVKNMRTEEFTNLHAPIVQSSISKILEINAIPTNYLVDRNGKVIAVNLHGEELRKKLKSLLN